MKLIGNAKSMYLLELHEPYVSQIWAPKPNLPVYKYAPNISNMQAVLSSVPVEQHTKLHSLIGNFNRDLVVLYTTPSIMGEFLVNAQRQCGGFCPKNILYVYSLRVKLIEGPIGATISFALNEPK